MQNVTSIFNGNYLSNLDRQSVKEEETDPCSAASRTLNVNYFVEINSFGHNSSCVGSPDFWLIEGKSNQVYTCKYQNLVVRRIMGYHIP